MGKTFRGVPIPQAMFNNLNSAKMQQNLDFKTTNPHSDHYGKFENKRLFDRLQKKFEPKPYHYQYRILRAVVLGSSYLFHILSAATAAALIFLFINGLVSSYAIAGTITAAALIALELSKRETSGRLFHDAFQFKKYSPSLMCAVIGLAAISTTCSYFGAGQAVRQFTPPPTLVNVDSTTAPLRATLASIDQQISAARSTKWNGKTTERSQRTIERLAKQKEKIVSEMVRQSERLDGRNDAAETKHQATTETNAAGFGMFTLACELLLILALFYLQYYDYRSFTEACALPAGNEEKLQTNVGAFTQGSNGHLNGKPITANMSANDRARTTKVVDPVTIIVNDGKRICGHCKTPYVYRHQKQVYCCDQCRVDAWQLANGREVKRGKAERN